MTTYHIIFQHPFEKNEQNWQLNKAGDIIMAFNQINWLQLNNDSYEKHDDVLYDYYFFDVSTDMLRENGTGITISGQYTYGKELDQSGPLVTIEYRYQQESISRGFLGLGSPKPKVKAMSINREDCTISFAQQCLQQFLNGNEELLKQNLNG